MYISPLPTTLDSYLSANHHSYNTIPSADGDVISLSAASSVFVHAAIKKKKITLEGFSEVIWQDEVSVLAMNLSIIFLWWSFHIRNKEAGSRQGSYGAWVAVSVRSIRFLEEEKILISAFPWYVGEMP